MHKQHKVPFQKEKVTRPLIEGAVLFLPKNSSRNKTVASENYRDQSQKKVLLFSKLFDFEQKNNRDLQDDHPPPLNF